MSLRFIYGRSGSGKSHFCLNEIKTMHETESETPLILLVPEQFTFQAEKQMIQALGHGGIIKTEVLSFRRMAFRIFNDMGGLTSPNINSAGKSMIIYRLLDKMKKEFTMFYKTADRKGFVSTLTTLITEFKRYDISSEKIAEFVEAMDEGDTLKQKLFEINLIYREFDKAIEERYRDSDDDLTIASKKLEASGLYNGAQIWIDGFSSFTPQEYRLIAVLLKKAGRLNISLCTDSLDDETQNKGIDTFSEIKGSYRKICDIAKDGNVAIERHVDLNCDSIFRFKNSPELSHIEKYINFYPYKIYEKETKDIQLFESVSIFSEIEACAAEIVKLCRDEDIRYREIGVVVGNLGEYESLIEAIFSDFEIPCFIDRKLEIVNHPLVRFILSMMDIFVENWSYKSVFEYLKTGFTGIARENIDFLENYVLARGIRGNRWTDSKEWTDKGFENLNDIKALVVSPLMRFREITKGRKNASEICGALYDFLNEMGIPAQIEEIVQKFKTDDRLELAGEYSQVWDTLMNVLDQTVEVMGNETFGIERFSNILKIGLAEYKIGLIPASLDQVIVGNIERSKSHEIKALFILGANDGQFPAATMEEGVLSDLDRAELKTSGIELANDTRSKALEERFMVYRALTATSRKLWMSWSIANQDGGSMRPCMTISRMKKLFPRITQRSNILEPETDEEYLEVFSAKTPAFLQMVRALRNKADGHEIHPVWKEVYKWFSGNEEWKNKKAFVIQAIEYKNEAKPISQKNVGVLYGDVLNSSVSKIERYSVCPFGYFAEYGLKAKERKVFKIGPPDVGSFLHEVIEEFSKQIEAENLSWRTLDKEWCRHKISDVVDQTLEKMPDSVLAGSKRYIALTKRLKRVVARAVFTISEQIKYSSFYPAAHEVDFGEGKKIAPIEIELASGKKIKLTGRIDRIDTMETEEGTYIRIVDYKSGLKSFNLSEVFFGLQIQLITYLDALWENGGLDLKKPILPAGMFYFHVDDPLISTETLITREEAEKLILARLKMNGIILQDVDVVKAMDSTIDGVSSFVPGRLKKDGSLGKSASVIPEEKFRILADYVRTLLKSVCGEILEGEVAIKPFKNKKKESCEYCGYSAFCQFDTTMDSNEFKIIRSISNDEIWGSMSNSIEAKGDGK